ncbi:acyl-CoA dehydrogenase family protein [Streptomyces sp. NBC_01795]|uniref:acyl-CoA dehydrogenase family protein n=1 Tax=unclassified Streptomyces TaxID=2593676 RepID=UPI002DD927A9|nr:MULTISPECIES: acyl-CoA dehydrogenase family protein [unclassified Streptomyces]WSA90623.1 acyl-CoA dehydrogenase family protein [Streptomyces sp. NBC_01795]WSB74950.1 acyl-CoA dehydrogenase family protein [Streptomyces sp. NBC_01775]WSS16769.1 acyl-CoA dehydrogenase family protein [Streptomyces sp. NBC_01186]
MTGRNPELDDFLDVLRKRLVSSDGSDADVIRATLQAADVLDLARETAEFDDALDWLIGTVRTTAHFSPSAAFALAGRLAAQRGLAALDTADADTRDVTSAVINPSADPWTAAVPTLIASRAVVLLDRGTGSATLAPWDSLVVEGAEGARRSGLSEAALRTVRLGDTTEELPDTVALAIARDWDLFTGAVALGLSERALVTAETYAAERRQFGSPISAFAGLRAMLAEMQIRICAVRSMLGRAAAGDLDTAEVLALAGRAAVDVCLDAIQVHGGYGYIDEYPVAGLLRDALSVRARGGGRRALVAQVAARRLGRAEGEA